MRECEHRTHVRRDCRLACIVQFASGMTVFGHSKSIGLDGLTVMLSSLPKTDTPSINNGDSGLLTLRFLDGREESSLKLQCQVTNKMASGLGLSIRLYELSKKEQLILGQLVATGTSNIG